MDKSEERGNVAGDTAIERLTVFHMWRKLSPRDRVLLVDLLLSEYCLHCGEPQHKDIFPCPNTQWLANRTPAVTSEDAKAPERGLPKEPPQDNTQGRG